MSMLTIFSFRVVDLCSFSVDVLYKDKRFTDVLQRPNVEDRVAEWNKLTGLQQEFFLPTGAPKQGLSYTIPVFALPKVLRERLDATHAEQK